MPTRLLVEGDDLAALMHQVRQEMGPEARVVRAERVRTGGVAGFFARERYELTIEVPDASRQVPRARAGGRAPAGIDALLAAADAAEEQQAGPAPAPSPQPTVSTAGPSFADVLESMRRVVGGTDPQGAAADVPVQVVPAEVLGEVPVTEVLPARATLEEVLPAELLGEAPATDVAVSDVAATDAAAVPRRGSSVSALLELGVPTRLMSGFPDAEAPVPLSVLVRRFDRPPSARLLPGSVVVVAGRHDLALRTAVQIAQRAGIPPQDVVLAGDAPAVAGHGRRLHTATALARLRSRVPDDVPTVVALGVPEDREKAASYAALLAALDPHQAWAALDARHRSVELRRWVRAVGSGRAFDALAACHTFEAQAPGAILGVGTPVGWVDGLPATPVVWAAVLSERLADDAVWD